MSVERQHAGRLAVVDVRMDALKQAIDARDWPAVEWEFDRVRRSVDKLAAPVLLDALNLATALMAGDEQEMRAGYTADNAALAAAERYQLSADQAASLRRMLAAREET